MPSLAGRTPTPIILMSIKFPWSRNVSLYNHHSLFSFRYCNYTSQKSDQETMALSEAPTSIVPIQIRCSYDTALIKDIHLHCECGHNQRARIIGIHDDWALWFQCTKQMCPNTWYVCNGCADVRKKITQRDALKRHHKKQHLRTHLEAKKHKIENSAPPPLVCAQLPNDDGTGGSDASGDEERNTHINGWQPYSEGNSRITQLIYIAMNIYSLG